MSLEEFREEFDELQHIAKDSPIFQTDDLDISGLDRSGESRLLQMAYKIRHLPEEEMARIFRKVYRDVSRQLTSSRSVDTDKDVLEVLRQRAEFDGVDLKLLLQLICFSRHIRKRKWR